MMEGPELNGSLGDHFTFRRMIIPSLIQVVYWIATAVVILGGLNYLIFGDSTVERLGGLAAIIIGPVIVRLWAEIVMVVFRINGTLTDIKESLERRT